MSRGVTPPLLRHGQYVVPEFEGGAWGQSTEQERPGGQISGIVKRFERDDGSYETPLALGWIKAIYSEAIEYTGQKPALKGLGVFVGTLAASIGLLGAVGGAALVINVFISYSHAPLWLLLGTAVVGSVVIPFSALFATWALLFGIRPELYAPQDLPILFDRQHRKVYRLAQEHPAGLFFTAVFKPWPLRALEYEWDLIDAEHNAELVATGATAARNHALVFVVRKSADDPTIIDSFQIGSSLELGEHTVAGMWEHIRRFMEEGGPHVPHRDEPLTDWQPPKNWQQSIASTGVLGEGYFQRWNDTPMFMLLMHAGFFLTIPMALISGLGHWLSYKTAQPVHWPAEVKQAVGRPVRMGAGWAVGDEPA